MDSKPSNESHLLIAPYPTTDSFGLDASNSPWLLGSPDAIDLSLFGDSTAILPNNLLPWEGVAVPAPVAPTVQSSPLLLPLSLHASNVESRLVSAGALAVSECISSQAAMLKLNHSRVVSTPFQMFSPHTSAPNSSVASVQSRLDAQPAQLHTHLPVLKPQNTTGQMPIDMSLQQTGSSLLSPPLTKRPTSRSRFSGDNVETAFVFSSQLSPLFLLAGSVSSSASNRLTKPSPTELPASSSPRPQRRSIDESDLAAPKGTYKPKKSAKLFHLETKCSALESENESLEKRLAILKNGSNFFSQREQDLLDRVRALESQLGDSHRVMLQQLVNSDQ
ncbi:hypothetical protein BC830DRAFT_1125332, partial [Chytriomyces sp. MP71]